MTRLEAVIEKLRALPAEEQESWAAEIEFLLDNPAPVLSPEEWAELDRRMNDPDEARIPHEEVVAFLEKKYGA